jgi:hypothetical protein
MPQNPLLLTRQSLYELVWSKPISNLAGDFGISDVALAKRCRQVDVPIPYRGYWARKVAGQEPPKLPLPKYRSKAPKQAVRSGPEPEVRFTMPPHPVERESQSTGAAADEQAFQAPQDEWGNQKPTPAPAAFVNSRGRPSPHYH